MWVKAADGKVYNLIHAKVISIEGKTDPDNQNGPWVGYGLYADHTELASGLTKEEAETQFAAIIEHLGALDLNKGS